MKHYHVKYINSSVFGHYNVFYSESKIEAYKFYKNIQKSDGLTLLEFTETDKVSLNKWADSL